ncbi:MAG: molybdopterin biosynthesis protein [Anaerolineales bacterium]|nr:molybdopterin biosynthesis protein [Anaerolineales bacterium]
MPLETSRSVYLHDIPLREALDRFEDALEAANLLKPLAGEPISLEQALGRITAQPVWAQISSPHYHSAAMDGYALRANDTAGASDRNPASLSLDGQAAYVDTGDPLPDWADAVVPVENVEIVETEHAGDRVPAIRVLSGTSPWKNVRLMGEDMVATELVLPAGRKLRPVDLGAIAASGHATVEVWRKPRVAVIPSGSELVPIGELPHPGEIIEFNSLVLSAQIEDWGAIPTRFEIIPDDLEQLKKSVREAAREHDLILINAGSSAGSEDFTARVIADLGELLVHGIAVRPGHPVILGMVHPGSGYGPTPVVGVPGFPVSAALTGEIFVRPLLKRWLGDIDEERDTLRATITRKIHSSAGDDEYVRVIAGEVGGRWVAAPLSRGAGVISSLVRADGILIVPSGVQGHAAGEVVEIELYTPLDRLRRTILALGSHDLTLDLLAQFLALRGARLTSANLGSLGGLIALQRGEAHIAGSHLLDPQSGEFNLAYIERYLPDTPVHVIGLVEREQGLITASGNPKRISGLPDLAREDVTFVNRQRGSGTRILLDYHLERLSLSGSDIRGYQREEYTHLMVAASIASGRADAGLAIRAAAAALGLDFVPLYQERYDLVIPAAFVEDPKLAALFETLNDDQFKSQVEALPGYNTKPMGETIAVMNASK